jgi:hypothetical protein
MLRCLARRTFTMPKFITHEAIASGLLNLNHCSAIGVTLPWQHHLTNNEKILDLIVRRMEADWTALKPQMRKAWGPTTLEPHHQKKESLFFWGGYLLTSFSLICLFPSFLTLIAFHWGPGSFAEGVRRIPGMCGAICGNGASCFCQHPSSRNREDVS